MTTGRARIVAVMVAVVVTVAGAANAAAAAGTGGSRDNDIITIRERLTGYQEDPAPISTPGRGLFRARVDPQAQRVSYILSYANLVGTVTQAHIHFGGVAQSGGVIAFLCSNVGGPVGTQPCPADPATISGVIRPINIVGPVAQGIAPGEFNEFVAALRAGRTYVNIHTTLYPTGEIRAQLNGNH